MMRGLAAAAAVALILGAGGCAAMRDTFFPGRTGYGVNEIRGQVPVFDGHEIWVDYACDGGSTLRVRFNGAWADATLANGAMVRLARTDAGGPRPNFANGAYSLTGPGLSPTWTTPSGAAQCTGSLA